MGDLIDGALTEEQANAAYTILVAWSGAPEDWRDMFVANQTADHCREWRFQGRLGFGGKFWRCNNNWYVTAYEEDMRPGMQDIIDRTNQHLAALLEAEMGPEE